ncbi:MAG: hypothetical protein GF388_00120, partial [Candidatus Aegiribacteria sp.]|nr:hypothetical protein [Candidatus Aegiribacteria sp.]MBD3293866.1 hypothetical protein [Candidatus Fermentibacteria bacterium]
MKRILSWVGGAKGKRAGFSFLSFGNLMIAFITYLRFAEIARIFGTTWQTDAVAIAMVIPLLLQQLIATAFGDAFMPIYSRIHREKGPEASNRLVSQIISWMVLSGFVLMGLVLIKSSSVVRLVGPGAGSETTALAARLLQIYIPLVFMNAIEGVLQNFLIYGKRYGLISIVRVLQILVSYLVVIFDQGSMGIMLIPVSGLIGAFVSFSTCSVIAFIYRFRLHPVLDPGNRDFRELVKLALPIMAGTVMGFLGPVADKVLASFLRASSITAIDYATRLKNLVRIILIQPVTVLSTVAFSRIAARGNARELRSEISSFIKHISYYSIPIAGIFAATAVPIISILFQRGNFGPRQSQLVGYALTFYSPWFAQFGIGLILRRAFYAQKESITPVFLGIWAIVANVLLSVILLPPLGIGGLALGSTLSSTAKTILLAYFFNRYFQG